MLLLMEESMKKNNIIIISVMVLMIIAIGGTAYINRENLEEKKQLNTDAIFSVIVNGEEVASYNMEEIAALGETTFKANLKSSGKAPIEYEYTGVLLKLVIEDAGVSIEDMNNAVVSAIDGYVVAYTIDKLAADDNIYLAYKREGELIGTRDDGGRGPYQVIVSKDKFSQYWVKYAYSVELNE